MLDSTANPDSFNQSPPFTLFGMTPEATLEYIEWCDAQAAEEAEQRMEQARIDSDWVAEMELRDAQAARLSFANVEPIRQVAPAYAAMLNDVMTALFGKVTK